MSEPDPSQWRARTLSALSKVADSLSRLVWGLDPQLTRGAQLARRRAVRAEGSGRCAQPCPRRRPDTSSWLLLPRTQAPCELIRGRPDILDLEHRGDVRELLGPLVGKPVLGGCGLKRCGHKYLPRPW